MESTIPSTVYTPIWSALLYTDRVTYQFTKHATHLAPFSPTNCHAKWTADSATCFISHNTTKFFSNRHAV
jgi:hypothetical protein